MCYRRKYSESQMQALTLQGQTIFRGCLARAVDGGDRWTWKRHWVSSNKTPHLYFANCAAHPRWCKCFWVSCFAVSFPACRPLQRDGADFTTSTVSEPAHDCAQVWLLQDRLCYVPITSAGKSIQYIPLDRITVRPLPRGYQPCIGVQHIDEIMVALQASRAGKTMSGQPPGRAFSVQYGARTVYWAARTSQEAKVSQECYKISDKRGSGVLDNARCHACCGGCLVYRDFMHLIQREVLQA